MSASLLGLGYLRASVHGQVTMRAFRHSVRQTPQKLVDTGALSLCKPLIDKFHFTLTCANGLRVYAD